jgi:hypothetical protein
MGTEPLPPGVYPIAVDKYINIILYHTELTAQLSIIKPTQQ